MRPERQVIIVTHEYLPKKGGIAVYSHELARAASECHSQVEVWAPNSAIDAPGPPGKPPFAVVRLPNRGTHGPLSVLSTARVFRRMANKMSDAHVCLVEPGPIYAAMLLELFGGIQSADLSLVLHGSEILKISKSAPRKHLFNRLMSRVTRVGVVSKHNKRQAMDLLSVPENKIRLVPGAVRHDLLSKEHTPVPTTSDKSDARLVLLTLARVHPRKGQHAVLEAFKHIPQPIQEKIAYHIAGPIVDAAYQQELEILATSSRVPVRFLGELPDDALTSHLKAADIFIMTPQPYKHSVEGFGMVYLEAGACSVPSIAHDIGGVADAVRHEQTGLLVSPGDSHALAQAITRLVQNPQLRNSMGTAARQRALEHSWQDNAQLLFEVISND